MEQGALELALMDKQASSSQALGEVEEQPQAEVGMADQSAQVYHLVDGTLV